MAIRGLFSRLESGNVHVSRRAEPTEEIIQHLRVLLNTRKGEAAAAAGFGVMDINDLVHGFPAAIERLQASLRETIQEFEPRLKNVIVQHVPDEQDPSHLRFEIIAQLVHRGARQPIRLFTRMGRNSQVELY